MCKRSSLPSSSISFQTHIFSHVSSNTTFSLSPFSNQLNLVSSSTSKHAKRSRKAEEVPHIPPHGENHKKNRRTMRARSRRKAKERKLRLQIDSSDPIYRKLRAPAYASLRKEKQAIYIHPWMRNNPAFRLQERDYPRASLLGVPKEIRQKILAACLEGEWTPKVSKGRGDLVPRSARVRGLNEKIAFLCCLSPVIRMDMEYVAAQKKKELAEGKPEKGAEGEMLSWFNRSWRMDEDRKAKLFEAQLGRKGKGRHRGSKCWKCSERHLRGGKHSLRLL